MGAGLQSTITMHALCAAILSCFIAVAISDELIFAESYSPVHSRPWQAFLGLGKTDKSSCHESCLGKDAHAKQCKIKVCTGRNNECSNDHEHELGLRTKRCHEK